MRTLGNHLVLWLSGLVLLLASGGCAALRGEAGTANTREYNPDTDGYNYYDEMDDYYYEYMGY